MAPNDYYSNGYNYNQPNSSQQAYSSYQAQAQAPAAEPTTRPYQSQTLTTTQPDYMPYPAGGYHGQGSYGQQQQQQQQQQQDGSWSNSRAAEALRNLSNTAYTTGTTTAVSSGGFTPASAPTSNRYSNATAQPSQSQYDSRLSSTQASSGQTQARPRSVNATATAHALPAQSQSLPSPAVTASYPSQRIQANFSQQRSASPAHPVYQPNQSSTHSNSNKHSNSTASAQHNQNNRVLPHVTEASRPSLPSATSASYNYSNRQFTAPVVQPTNQFEQPAITVDPQQVYDPWPEYQRKQATLQAQKAAEDAARAEEKRKIDEARRVEEARKKAEDDKKAAEEKRKADERRKLEEERHALEPQVPVPVLASVPEKKPRKPRAPKMVTATHSTSISNNTAQTSGSVTDNTEAEIRALMAKMRELNQKDPALLAKIWEQERKSHVAQQASTQTPAAPSPTVQAGQIPRKQDKKSVTTKALKETPKQGPSISGTNLNGTSNTSAPIQSSRSPNAHLPTPPQMQQAQRPGQALRPVRQQGGTIWPPDKKEQLAATASEWINMIPENKDKPTTSGQILRMLDSNPSYIDLCEKLESLGLKLERAAFAKALLAAVPDVNSASRQPAQAMQRPVLINAEPNGIAGSVGISRHPGTPVQPGPKDRATNRTSLQTSTTQLKNAPPISRYPPPEIEPSTTPYYNNSYPPFPGADSPVLMPEPNSPPTRTAPIAVMVPKKDSGSPAPKPVFQKPANKEAAARKRDFSEFVDLTALSDEDDLLPVKKLIANQNLSRQSAPPSTVDSYAPSPNFSNFPIHKPTHGVPVRSTTPPMKDPRFANIVQPINREKALRRSGYDIKTIARDVLLATGRHPEMRPLNAHLDILKSSFSEIDNTSDLSTIRWDIIDPGQPPPGYLQNSLFTQEQEDADDEETDDEARARTQPRVGIQQTVGIRESSERAFSATTPSFNGQMKGAPKRRGRPPRASYPTTSRPYGFGNGEASNPRTTVPPVRTSADSERVSNSRTTGSSGSYGTSESLALGSRAAATASAPRTGATGYGALRPVNEDGTPIKKKGRPVGWRLAVHGSAEAQARTGGRKPSSLRKVSTAGAAADSADVSRGAKPTNKIRTEVNYQVFKCKWRDCTAELVNLEILRRHVHKIHGKAAAHGGFDCLWENCGKDITVHDKRTGEAEQRHQYFGFADFVKWKEHLELKHFGPIAWTMGDGPPSGLSDAAHDSDAYTSNRRRVTPKVTAPSSIHDDPSVGRAASSAAPEPPRRGRPPKASQEQVAQDAEDAMVRKKRAIGAGVDKGGARMVTPKRRRGFDDAEDFDEIIVDSSD